MSTAEQWRGLTSAATKFREGGRHRRATLARLERRPRDWSFDPRHRIAEDIRQSPLIGTDPVPGGGGVGESLVERRFPNRPEAKANRTVHEGTAFSVDISAGVLPIG